MKKTLLSILLGLGLLTTAGAQTIILSEDFQTGSIPASWSQTTLASDGGWLVGTNTALSSTSFPFPAHTLFAGTNDDGCNCDKSSDILITPAMDLSSYTNVFLSFESFYVAGTYQGISEVAKVIASTDGGITWTDAGTIAGNTSGWATNNVDLSAFSGNASVLVGFKYNDGGGWLYGWGVDDISVFAPQAGTDLSVSTTVVGKEDPTPAFVGFSKYLTGLPLSVSTTVDNLGTIAINSFDFSWSDGTNTYNQSFTGLNIAPLSSYTFVSNTTYTTLAGSTTITSTVSNINNGASELSTANNSDTYTVNGVTAHPEKKYFVEEGTGTWCGWCPRGTVFMEYMRDTYPNQFVGIAVHNADPMVVAAYDAGIGALIAGYPSVVANRTDIIDPSEMEGNFIDNISTAPSVVISANATVNAATNAITVDLTGVFNQNLSGDYRFMAVVAEDSVSGVGSTWGQTNYYANNAQGPMGGFEALGSPVPAASIKYYFVNRALLGTFNGQTGSIPASVTSGTPYNYQFTATSGAAWVKSRLYLAAVVIDASTGAVLNTGKFPINIITGIDNIGSLKGSYIYPTLTSDILNLSVNLEKSQKVTVVVTDVVGKEVMSQDLGMVPAGSSTQVSNVSNLANGVYVVSMITADGKMTQKFVKQ
ncbi:hypothetical protein BH11BAC2_BH11BAC2_21140 [soil metagenome]